MKIKFTIAPDENTDEYHELYSADVTMEDGTSFTVRVDDTEASYDAFRSDIFEDLFLALAEATGINVEVEEEDYASFEIDDITDYEIDEASKCGC